ncbi:LysM peptidoglycan-binding domain-containing protein [bacterium]|nr:LysM peptidoglycan-binding domain-containing protein [bacterium]
MKIEGKKYYFLFVLMGLLLVVNAVAWGQEEERMKMDEYKAQLSDAQMREQNANARLAELQAEIDALNAQIAEVQGQIDDEWEDVYALLGTNKAGVDAYRANLESIDREIDGLAALSPEELFRRQDQIDEIESRIEEAKGSNIAILTEMENKLAELNGKLTALKAKVPANIYDQYTVVDGDYLWKISKKEEIYGDPMQWMRIYSVNKDQIKDPDLIYANQIFNIARGVGRNEHLVVKGEHLSSISGYAKVFNDPTKWTKLYEANKDMIDDPNIIYPYQVLMIPAE